MKVKVLYRDIDTKKKKCRVCGYIYDPQKGDEKRGIPPGTPFEKLPDSWRCPVCKYTKAHFITLKEFMLYG
jgi:rubredoxin